MHDAAFAGAAVPAPIRILRLVLRPYSVGHALWLQAALNPLAEENSGLSVKPYHVIEAVWTCSCTWRELRRQHEGWLTLLKVAVWRRRSRRLDLALAGAEFQNYRRAGSSFPPIESAGAGGRIGGAPLLARVIQFLVANLRKSEAEAMDFPLGLAYWHLAAWQESEGALKILNAGEMEFEDWCAQQDLERSRKQKAESRSSAGGERA